jgi:hypothetical protein
MRRISIAVTVMTLLLTAIVSAQQPSDNTDRSQNSSATQPPGPILGGMGTANYIPIWAAPSFLLNSVIYQASGGNVGIGTTAPAAKLDVNGNINSAGSYQITGSNVLGIGSAPDSNLFLGLGAGSNNLAGQGTTNTFSGYKAGYSNTSGGSNAFYGWSAGVSNTIGCCNTFAGWAAGYNNTVGGGGTFIGYGAGYSNTQGTQNTFVGSGAGANNTGGADNTFTGNAAGASNTIGSANTFYGFGAGPNNTIGSVNIFVGLNAGMNNTSGSSNVYIANAGPQTGAESNAIRIGTQGTGQGQQDTAYVAGIYGSISSSGIPVYINSLGQLGTQTSSLRFKEQVRDMDDSTDALMKLRPVTFLYKPEYANGERTLQYGLIAEEVAKIYPELVAYDKDGQPYSVRYQYLSTMLLNEFQKQYQRAEQQAATVASQQAKIEGQQREIDSLRQQLQLKDASVEERLSRLEKQLASQSQAIAQK